jgi:hypothetical protein|tara:strand:- start:95 stop:856 length:762 start_codon:yes stop_codon:yes gene_type:complete
MRVKKEKINPYVSHETSSNRAIENGEIWTKESFQGNNHGRKQKDRVYIVIGTIIDSIGKAIIMRDFDSNNLVAKEQITIEEDPLWVFHPQASIEEEVIVTKKVNLNNIIKKEHNNPILIPQNNPYENKVEEQHKDEDKITWGHYGSYRYQDLELLGLALIGTKAIADPMYKKKWKNGFYQAQGMQALDMWRDQEKTIAQICQQQPYISANHDTKEEDLKIPAVQTMVRRIAKTIWKHGTKEEKQLLFYPVNKQ